MRRALAPLADAGASPLVRFEAVTKRYGDVVAVDGLSLDIHAGEFFALLGPSGCGKTTLLRLFAGFERADAGKLLLGGEDLAGVPPYRRPVNMMFQNYALFPHMTVARNVAFGLEQDGLPKPAIAARVAEMLALVKLDDLAGRKPHQLSGGQRQRVALARSLAKQPRVLLLDEPLAALDKKLREETQFELMDLQARLGTTFVIVTHDQDEAMTMAHRIAVMDRGRVMQIATPAVLYEQPNSRWVAEFIGDVNVIAAAVVSGNGDTTVVETASGRRLGVAGADTIAAGTPVFIAVRPEKIRLMPSPPLGGGLNCVAGRVADIGYLGDMSVYKVTLDDGTLMRASVTNARRAIEHDIAWEQPVWLSWPPDAAVLLLR
jgi:putrescine transport system ATP-binding protein